MSEASEVITAVVAACSVAGGLIGGAVAFVWGKVEKRFKEIETQLLACQSREDEGHERRANQLIVIELLWQEIKRLAPPGPVPVLVRARRLLDDLKISNERLNDLGDGR
jgi:hypothetical protein